MKKRLKEPKESVLTQRMDIGKKGFDEFQAILLNKSKSRTDNQRMRIDLLTLKYQMEDYLNTDDSQEKSVGDFLKLILKELNIQQKEFAEFIGLEPSNLSKLINGERSINYDLALIFGRLFSHEPLLWIEAKNELNRLLNAEKKKYSIYSLNDLVNEHKTRYNI